MTPSLSMSPPCSATSFTFSPRLAKGNGHHRHGRTESESLLFTPPLSPTEEQLLAFLIPDIEPSELAVYLSAPATPVLSDVSCLIGKSLTVSERQSDSLPSTAVEAVYPSPVCAAAAATVVAMDRLDVDIYPSLSYSPSSPAAAEADDHAFVTMQSRKKRSSTFAFEDEDEDEREKISQIDSPVYVMSNRYTRKRLMLEQAFVIPDDDDKEEDIQDCYAQLFHGASSDEPDSTLDLSSNLAYDLVLA
ncbi:hypothetical protein BGX28_003733 [Mortierella sp. GBA30]|nr:hypothetical protein BGX28_003733 [Mortierella sp. GBA30]